MIRGFIRIFSKKINMKNVFLTTLTILCFSQILAAQFSIGSSLSYVGKGLSYPALPTHTGYIHAGFGLKTGYMVQNVRASASLTYFLTYGSSALGSNYSRYNQLASGGLGVDLEYLFNATKSFSIYPKVGIMAVITVVQLEQNSITSTTSNISLPNTTFYPFGLGVEYRFGNFSIQVEQKCLMSFKEGALPVFATTLSTIHTFSKTKSKIPVID
jgi:hypothetical protein